MANIIRTTSGSAPSLYAAIKSAMPGDTIVVASGRYLVENIRVTKSLTIIGEQYPVLDGGGKHEILTIEARNVGVYGIHFMNSGYSSSRDLAAISIINSSGVTVGNNKLTNTYFGIHAANSVNFKINNNKLIGVTKTEQTSGNGIHLWKCSNAVIESNDCSGHRDGIYFEFVTGSQIRKNVSYNNIRYGLHFMFSNDDVYTDNEFRQNGAGVAVMFSRGVTMLNNIFTANWGDAAYGLLLKEISDSKISDNRFIKNTVGIYMEGASRIVATGNIFTENGWAARVQASCSDNTFEGNNFMLNTFDVATNGTMVLSTFNGNYWDKYEGYDLNKDGTGDVPYHPVSLYSMLVEQNPNSLILLRSFLMSLLDKAEKAIPSLTPIALKDNEPKMKKIDL
jgi:nitrous oxidase accessory protein